MRDSDVLSRRNIGLAGFAVLCICGRISFAQVTVDLSAAADSFVLSSRPNANYGGADLLSVSSNQIGHGEFQTILRFDASSLRSYLDALFGNGQWTIQNVLLRLTAAPADNPIFNPPSAGSFAISWMQNDSWTEGTGGLAFRGGSGITFNLLPSFIGGGDQPLGAPAFDGSSSGVRDYSLPLQLNFKSDLTAGNLVSLRIYHTAGIVSYLFRSRESGTPADRPQLLVTAVPEPGALALLAMGLLGVCYRRVGRRHENHS